MHLQAWVQRLIRFVVRKEAFTRPHRLVGVTFKPRLSLLKKLVMDAPQKLPIEPIIGQAFA